MTHPVYRKELKTRTRESSPTKKFRIFIPQIAAELHDPPLTIALSHPPHPPHPHSLARILELYLLTRLHGVMMMIKMILSHPRRRYQLHCYLSHPRIPNNQSTIPGWVASLEMNQRTTEAYRCSTRTTVRIILGRWARVQTGVQMGRVQVVVRAFRVGARNEVPCRHILL